MTGSTATGSSIWLTHRPWLWPVLALWGWQTEVLILAFIMAVVLEAPRILEQRIDIAQEDFNRLWSFTTVLLLGVIFYLFLARQGFASFSSLANADSSAQQEGAQRISSTALTFLRWLPFIMFPFTAAHAWSRSAVLPWSTFSLYEQSRAKRHPDAPVPEWATVSMNPGYVFAAVVLFASTTAAIHAEAFTLLFLVVFSIVLWPWTNRGYGVKTWIFVLLLYSTVAFFSRYSREVSSKAWELLDERFNASSVSASFGSSNSDQDHRRTALGQVGVIQNSGSIILRISTPDKVPPGLLREAIFNRYRNGIWDLPRQGFQPLDEERTESSKGNSLVAAKEAQRSLSVSRFSSENGELALAVPSDYNVLSTTPALTIESNDLASLRVRGCPPLVRYAVQFGAGVKAHTDGVPGVDDLQLKFLDPEDLETVEAVAAELHISRHQSVGPASKVAIDRLEKWFAKDFTYSRWQGSTPNGSGPLTNFLRNTHSGHCEFYATTTALILRAAGIPTRYVTGFSVQEERGDMWLARGRDAHAWCIAWCDGSWQVVDNTPGVWRANEGVEGIAWSEKISDVFSQAWFHFAAWRQDGGGGRIVVLVVGMLVLAWIGWRQLRGSRWRRIPSPKQGHSLRVSGLDSEFLMVLKQLESRVGVRFVYETPEQWYRRSQISRSPTWIEADLLHQRLRFDPVGLNVDERLRLRHLASVLSNEITTIPFANQISH